ncbi:MAG TPA: D-2-hydroxyacid dehydrogenase family protein [Burkholderiales bacterium]|jgi:phosphoglycerate dehydrogenase-like enzyme|nr:D-2-hydroxyacid dehydrogenase family protein [Burkholderiales bacterium]
MRVAILDDIHHAYEGTAGLERLRARAEVKIFTTPFGEPHALGGFEALVANRERTRFTRALLEQLPDLRIIAQTGNHAYHIDLEAAEAHGVIVARATGGFSYGAAELAIGLAMALMRGIPQADSAVKRGEWRTPMTRVLHGKTLGIVGLGHVGRHVASLAAAFGMKVLTWSRGGEPRQLDELLRASDVVSIHATLSPESRGLIDARRIALMKPTAYLINTARGAIVDERALAEALESRRIAGAGLDVFEQEPLPAGHPLARLDNVVLTPHLGWPTDEAYGQFADAAADILLAYLDGKPLPRFSAHA